ncbi:TonB-dependent receptor domain-containing protein [Crenobacter intestini]|nr:TonB-dependent receptor [Crenobacter intestini]
MFARKPLAALIALAITPAAFAATVPLQAEEVVVTATRTPTPVSKVLSDVTVITREEIEETGATQLTELLARQPGIEVASTGGLGSNASVFIRGANSDHTVILVDGVRIVSGTLGTTALQHIPLELIDRVEILRGPASSLYGADAIGGVIQVFTRKGSGAPKFHASLGFGEYGTVETGAGINGKVGDTAFGLNLSHQSTNGFSAQNAGADSKWGKHNPDRDAYRETGYSAYLSHTLAPGQALTARAFQTFANNEFDSDPTRQDETKTRLAGQSIESRNQLTDNWTSTLRFSHAQDKQDTSGAYPSLYQTTQNEWTWQNDFATSLGNVQLGVDHRQQKIDSSKDYAETDKTVKSVFAGYQGEFGQSLLQASVRNDDDSLYGNKTTGQFGYGLRFAEGWLARAAYGTAFKAPTFNQRFYPGSENPDIRPETSRNTEAALEWNRGVNMASLTWFRNQVEDLIEWAPNPARPGWSLPSNVSEARLAGYTLEAGTQLAGFDLSASATWLDARNSETGQRLVRRAQRFASANVSRMVGDWTLGGSVQASGERLDKDPDGKRKILPGYATVNLYADLKLDAEWTATARVENVADRDYETAYGYNTAGRTWFVGVRYQPK